MKASLYFIALSFLLSLQISCTPTSRTNTEVESSDLITELQDLDSIKSTKKNEYQLADDLVDNLIAKGADTVLFYKRTCISCCDFYTVFWTKSGKQFLHKFSFDFSIQVELKDSPIFSELSAAYSSLKKNSIKENAHDMKDGTSRMTMSDHYCYSVITIYTPNDSIISNRMKDTDFHKDSGIKDENGVEFVNDNYSNNIGSKWHSVLTTIESELSVMNETSDREKEVMRMTKN